MKSSTSRMVSTRRDADLVVVDADAALLVHGEAEHPGAPLPLPLDLDQIVTVAREHGLEELSRPFGDGFLCDSGHVSLKNLSPKKAKSGRYSGPLSSPGYPGTKMWAVRNLGGLHSQGRQGGGAEGPAEEDGAGEDGGKAQDSQTYRARAGDAREASRRNASTSSKSFDRPTSNWAKWVAPWDGEIRAPRMGEVPHEGIGVFARCHGIVLADDDEGAGR